MGQPYAKVALPDPHLVMQRQKRDQRQLQRHDQHGDHGSDQQRAARKLHPSKGIGRKSRDQNGNDRRRDRHGQRVEKGTCHAFAIAGVKQHAPVICQREFRRAFGGHKDALATPADLIVIAAPDVIAVFRHVQGFPLTQIGDLARCESRDIARRDAPCADHGGDIRGALGAAIDDVKIAFDDENAVTFDAELTGIGGAEHLVLHGGKHRRPPARGADLVGCAERRHQKPQRGKHPQKHQCRHRQMHRPCQAGFLARDVIHGSVLPSGRGPSPHLLAGVVDVPHKDRRHQEHDDHRAG